MLYNVKSKLALIDRTHAKERHHEKEKCTKARNKEPKDAHKQILRLNMEW